jgi:hypothetical protein
MEEYPFWIKTVFGEMAFSYTIEILFKNMMLLIYRQAI